MTGCAPKETEDDTYTEQFRIKFTYDPKGTGEGGEVHGESKDSKLALRMDGEHEIVKALKPDDIVEVTFSKKDDKVRDVRLIKDGKF
ncbi:hypothetical protein [Bacillus cereus]|uniref:hypothetical protein n=1 Tax=Bacillus cereus TaxID=1396 RepID=UPI0018F76C73